LLITKQEITLYFTFRCADKSTHE